jgi:Domain of unknown function (DUF4276)
MKRLIIVCEGPTEREFCSDVLYPYFLGRKILIETPLIKKSAGGIVPWQYLKKQIETHLIQDKTVYVTTFIDFYGIDERHGFLKWNESKTIVDKSEQLLFLEQTMQEDIDKNLAFRFIPYLQLHEFEGLLFNNLSVFKTQIPEKDILNLALLEQIINDYPNPELINDGKTTAPSKRLAQLIRGYNKPVYGAILAEMIGLTNIRSKCPRFNNWIINLENI